METWPIGRCTFSVLGGSCSTFVPSFPERHDFVDEALVPLTTAARGFLFIMPYTPHRRLKVWRSGDEAYSFLENQTVFVGLNVTTYTSFRAAIGVPLLRGVAL